MKNKYPKWLREAARKGGKSKSAKKAASSAENGNLGGRPLSPEKQLELVEEFQAKMKRAGICFAIVARFGPGNGGAFLCGSPRRAEMLDENGQTLADNMRYWADQLDNGTLGATSATPPIGQPSKRRPRMEIYANPGSKVIMDYPEAGWPNDQLKIKELGLVEGQSYTVDHTEVHSSSTTLFLVEYPGERFNTVNFCDADKK
ncbi:MAG: hypothetical protein KGL39_40190 [Patescibacteria group bacterium]|nr:hypothetical protein [Patescibacteria group bacterium]